MRFCRQRPISWLTLHAERGFSATEVATILAAASLMTAAVKPVVTDYVASARTVRADHDARSIATAFVRLAGDVRGAARDGSFGTYRLLVSDGGVPDVGRGGDRAWAASADLNGRVAVGRLQDFLVGSRDEDWKGPAGWRGPYIDSGVEADPWNRRYAINVESFFRSGREETFVLSAGPNGLIETPIKGAGIRPGGDDVLALVSSGGF